jgi:hypothetical protein
MSAHSHTFAVVVQVATDVPLDGPSIDYLRQLVTAQVDRAAVLLNAKHSPLVKFSAHVCQPLEVFAQTLSHETRAGTLGDDTPGR